MDTGYYISKKDYNTIINYATAAYETMKAPDGSLPLLEPMSEIAGKMSVQQGARALEKTCEGRGVLLGGVEEAGVRGADELDLDGGRLGHDQFLSE